MNISRKINTNSPKVNNESIKQLFDIQTLDLYCGYVISMNKNIKVSGLNLVNELFKRVDKLSYGNDIDRINRIEFITRGLEARLVKKLSDKKLILQYINGGILSKPLIDVSTIEEISDETLTYLTEQAAELVKSYFVDDKYEQILRLTSNLRVSNYRYRSEIIDQIQHLTSEMNLQFNKIDESVNSSSMFTLVPGEFENAMDDIYMRETSPSRILKTGMTGLNIMLDGGFQSSRVYLLMAQAAGGKSFTLLDLAIQLKKHNKNYVAKDPTKIPTIVILTMENSEDENVARMLSMISQGKTFNDCSFEDSIQTFRSNGLGYSKDDPIDIVMIYKSNLSINTDYLYVLVDKLREIGREPICLIQDHIKRIRPTNKRNDMRLDLGEIINEFKAFANHVGIPVITDTHLNRDASKTLDESSSSNKKDLIRSLGSFNVSESFLMIDNCDVGIIINKEMDANELLYMGFKCIKTRTKCDLDLFYQPYLPGNSIKLVEDINLTIPSFRRSLKDDQPVTPRFSRRNDFNRIHHQDHSDDDDMFSEEIIGSSTDGVYIVSGQPSNPVYSMPPKKPMKLVTFYDKQGRIISA